MSTIYPFQVIQLNKIYKQIHVFFLTPQFLIFYINCISVKLDSISYYCLSVTSLELTKGNDHFPFETIAKASTFLVPSQLWNYISVVHQSCFIYADVVKCITSHGKIDNLRNIIR